MKRVLLIFSLLAPSFLLANNIQVSNISLTNQDINANTLHINFDVSWENSWRISSGPSNWDAAWVFVKYRTTGNSWQHVNINYVNGTNDGHTAPSGSVIKTAEGGKGCFIYRSTDGAGNIDLSGVKLLWNYGALSDDASVEIKVFAIEMVYVPQGGFYLGNGFLSSEVNRFYSNSFIFPTAYFVSSENAITVNSAQGNLYYTVQQGSSGGDQLGPIPAAFPKGYDAFYCMKYEMSQGQYVAFFNTLTISQKPPRDLSNDQHKNSDLEVTRNGFAWESGLATTTKPDVPLTYVSTTDAFAYLDWSGLRPLTELEYEKACRGTQSPIVNEFAWGNNEIPSSLGLPYTYLNEGTPNETISNRMPEAPGVIISSTNGTPTGPKRCGIVAASAINKNRTESGGTYYGIMEMSGNVYERLVSVGTPDGRGFTGLHGDGVLTSNGGPNVANWPLINTGGIGYRGASYANTSEYMRVCDRFDAANASDIVNSRIGFRGAHSAQ